MRTLSLITSLFALAVIPLAAAESGAVPFPSTGLGEGYGGYSQRPIWISNGQFARLVSGTENLLNPSGQASALHVTNDLAAGQPRFSFAARLWEGADPAPLKGAVEWPVRLVKGAIRISMGMNPEPLTDNRSTIGIMRDQVYYVLVLNVGTPPRLHADKTVPTEWNQGETLAPDQSWVIRFEWDFTPGQKPSFGISLNDSPLLIKETMQAHWTPGESIVSRGGINVMMITSTAAADTEFYLGPVTYQAR